MGGPKCTGITYRTRYTPILQVIYNRSQLEYDAIWITIGRAQALKVDGVVRRRKQSSKRESLHHQEIVHRHSQDTCEVQKDSSIHGESDYISYSIYEL